MNTFDRIILSLLLTTAASIVVSLFYVFSMSVYADPKILYYVIPFISVWVLLAWRLK